MPANSLTSTKVSGKHWTDHKVVGLQYAAASFFFLFVGFLLMLLIRWQLAWPTAPLPPALAAVVGPNNAPGGYLVPEFYNQLVAMHGTVMIFLAVVPLLTGAFGNYLVPLHVGAPIWRFRGSTRPASGFSPPRAC